MSIDFAGNEEARHVLRRIIERLSWRQIATINILGHCLKLVQDLDRKSRVVTELQVNLELFERIRTLYKDLGWQDIASRVRDRIDQMPYPASRVEFGIAYHVLGVAEQVSMRNYLESSYEALCHLAQAYVDAAPSRPEPTHFVEFASEASNRPLAQQYLNRWASIAISSFGQPGSPTDKRAISLGLRQKAALELGVEFQEALKPITSVCELTVPIAEELA